ncbi:MAG TPA: EamA family transporter [Streptosporangiaceae bacterium]|nr:EamA family transporter [Streptosporangiaceae bacterium]
MTLIMLSLGSAVVYGAADFFGGAASRRASARSVLLVSLPIGLVVLIVAALATGHTLSAHDSMWALVAGLAGGGGLIVFYDALARGPMSVVAPVAALVSALLPVAAGLAGGERPTPSVLIGVAICLAAICLVSLEEPRAAATDAAATDAAATDAAGPAASDRRRRPRSVRGPLMAALSGVGFGVFFILLREAGRHDWAWALVVSRAAGLAVVIAVVLGGWALTRASRRSAAGVPARLIPTDPAALLIAVLTGILDSLANTLYVFASRAGMLSLAAVLTSMYPAITVLLARVVYSERLRMVQRLGVALALAGVALVTAG